MITFFLNLWNRLSAYALAGLAVVIAILSGAYYEREKGKQAQQAADNKQAANDAVTATEIDTKVRQLPPNEAETELRKDWSRD